MRVFISLLVPLLFSASAAHADHTSCTGRAQDPPGSIWIRGLSNEKVAARAEPLVADGRVFIGTCSGKLHALNLRSGFDLWDAALDGPVIASAATAPGLCIVATTNGSVYALN